MFYFILYFIVMLKILAFAASEHKKIIDIKKGKSEINIQNT